jgi:hypothetical protein
MLRISKTETYGIIAEMKEKRRIKFLFNNKFN